MKTNTSRYTCQQQTSQLHRLESLWICKFQILSRTNSKSCKKNIEVRTTRRFEKFEKISRKRGSGMKLSYIISIKAALIIYYGPQSTWVCHLIFKRNLFYLGSKSYLCIRNTKLPRRDLIWSVFWQSLYRDVTMLDLRTFCGPVLWISLKR